MALVLDPRRLSGAEFRFLRTVLELDIVGLARVIGLKPGTLERWEAGVDPVGPMGERLLRALVFSQRHSDAGQLIGLVREIETKDLMAILTALKPAVGPRVLRLKCREVSYQKWAINSEPETRAVSATSPVRLVEPTAKAQ